MTTRAPEVARPDLLASLTPEEREQIAKEVRFADFSASLEFRNNQELIQIKRLLERLIRESATLKLTTIENLVRQMRDAQQMTLLVSLGYGDQIRERPEFVDMCRRWGIQNG
jgi:hypothetical protein